MNVKVVPVLCRLIIFTLVTLLLPPALPDAGAAPLSGRVVVVDPGGGGAAGCGREDDLSVARELARLLAEKGAAVYLTGNEPAFFTFLSSARHEQNSLAGKLRLVAARRPDLYIGLEVNADPRARRRGAVTFYRRGNLPGRLLAESIQASLCRIPAMEKRTARTARLYLLDHLDIPAVVVELGCLSRPAEWAEPAASVFRKQLAGALCRGINNYFAAGKTMTVQARSKGGRAAGAAGAGGPRIALVIDDFGFNGRPGVEEMFALNRPLTFAVMPNLPDSCRQARRAAACGYEVIVHLPMQPFHGRKSWLGPGAITAGMSAREIKEKTAAALAAVPYAVGFNNHMGSLITSREEMLRPVLEAAAARGFFVLDSRTTEKSRLYPLARRMGLPCVGRDVFLDDVQSVPYVKKQLELLAAVAERQGSAVGIGHVGHPATARALAEMLPVLEARGIELVYLSELAR